MIFISLCGFDVSGLLLSVFRSASWGIGARKTQIGWVREHYYLYPRTDVNSNEILAARNAANCFFIGEAEQLK
jgi:hypothetical protein